MPLSVPRLSKRVIVVEQDRLNGLIKEVAKSVSVEEQKRHIHFFVIDDLEKTYYRKSSKKLKTYLLTKIK